jgi:hypothetical protein
MTNIGKIAWVSAARHTAVGPKHDPYARDTRHIRLKSGILLTYHWCGLTGEVASYKEVSTSKDYLYTADLLTLGLPTHAEVERKAEREEIKAAKREVQRYRREGMTKRQAKRQVEHDADVYAEMDAFYRAQE